MAQFSIPLLKCSDHKSLQFQSFHTFKYLYIFYRCLKKRTHVQKIHLYFIYLHTLNAKPEVSFICFEYMVFLLCSPRKRKHVIFYLLHLEYLEPVIFRTGSSTRHADREAGRLTQGYPGSTSIRVDPEGEPGQDHNQQGWRINTHHVEANLSPQGEDDLHATVVSCQSEKWQVGGS